MKYLPYGHTRHRDLITLVLGLLWQRVAGALPPMVRRLHLSGGRRHLGKWAPAVLVLVGLVMQMVLLVLVGQLVDTCLDIAELWLQLARKHLEITL